MTIQRAFGLIPRIIGKGDSAKVCLTLFMTDGELADRNHWIIVAPI